MSWWMSKGRLIEKLVKDLWSWSFLSFWLILEIMTRLRRLWFCTLFIGSKNLWHKGCWHRRHRWNRWMRRMTLLKLFLASLTVIFPRMPYLVSVSSGGFRSLRRCLMRLSFRESLRRRLDTVPIWRRCVFSWGVKPTCPLWALLLLGNRVKSVLSLGYHLSHRFLWDWRDCLRSHRFIMDIAYWNLAFACVCILL
jgi:hypothetical protein